WRILSVAFPAGAPSACDACSHHDTERSGCSTAVQPGCEPMVSKIALEEHFLSPGLVDYWRPTMTEVAPERGESFFRHLTDFGELRLRSMDSAGITRAVLSIAGPGVQAERDAATATRRARESNDFLAGEIEKRPDRYSGFAHLAMQDAKAAA